MKIQRRAGLGWAVAVSVFSLVSLVGAQDAEVKRVSDIRANATNLQNEKVTVEGFATQWVPSTAKTTAFYILKDDWGSVIKIRTSEDKPEIGNRYRVSGVVGRDAASKNRDVYISEEERLVVANLVEDAASSAPVVASVPGEPEPVTVPPAESSAITEGGREWKDPVTYVLIVVVAALVILLVMLVVFLLGRRRKHEMPTAEISTSDPQHEPAPARTTPEPEVVSGKTVKIHKPPAGTLKILPGRLSVVSGEDRVKEIRFYRVGGQATPEVSFGRVSGAPYTHVQLNSPTVSSRQAKLTFINGQWILTNFAPQTSNPTVHNGIELPQDGQVSLNDADRIEMGEVTFVYHAA